MRTKRNANPRTISISSQHTIQRPNVGDEVFTTGVFYFNITAMLAWLEENPHEVLDVPVGIWPYSKPKDEAFVAQANITRPIVIAEIAPDYRGIYPAIPFDDWIARGYSLVDGYHRIEKAKGLGVKSLPAIVLPMEEHIQFMYKGYERYVDYWNEKSNMRNR